jgi:acyl-CoA thioesterase
MRPAPAQARHDFDADTALEPDGEGGWRAWAPDHWFVGRGPNGGFLAALAARAAESAAERPLRSLTLHFIAAPAVGPLEVGVALEREGRSYSAASVRIHQGGRPVTLALATLGRLAADGAAWDFAAAPSPIPLEQTGQLPFDQAGIPAFLRNYDLRWALGSQPGVRNGVPETGGWIRTTEPRALDAPLVAAMTDAWAPVAFAALGRAVGAPTLDLTIHIRRALPRPGMAPEDYVLGRFHSRLAVAGVWEEDGELWTPDGELIAQSRQLALVREPPGRSP